MSFLQPKTYDPTQVAFPVTVQSLSWGVPVMITKVSNEVFAFAVTGRDVSLALGNMVNGGRRFFDRMLGNNDTMFCVVTYDKISCRRALKAELPHINTKFKMRNKMRAADSKANASVNPDFVVYDINTQGGTVDRYFEMLDRFSKINGINDTAEKWTRACKVVMAETVTKIESDQGVQANHTINISWGFRGTSIIDAAGNRFILTTHEKQEARIVSAKFQDGRDMSQTKVIVGRVEDAASNQFDTRLIQYMAPRCYDPGNEIIVRFTTRDANGVPLFACEAA